MCVSVLAKNNSASCGLKFSPCFGFDLKLIVAILHISIKHYEAKSCVLVLLCNATYKLI